MMQAQAAPPAKAKKFRPSHFTPYLFLLPYLLFFLLFLAVPVGMSLVLSFFKWDYYAPMEWAGLNNFKLIFNFATLTARKYWGSVGNTLLFVLVMSPLLIVVPLIIALLLNTRVAGRKLFRGVFYFPTILSISTVSLIWYFLLDTNIGILNLALKKTVPWVTQQPYAWISLFMLSLWWGIGGNMVLYLAGLQNVDGNLVEAGKLDGANGLQLIRYVTLPQLAPTMVYVSIMTVLSNFNVFGQPFMLTAGGPDESTTVSIMYIYNTAFGGGNKLGRASAMSLVLGLIMCCFTVLTYRMNRNEVKHGK